MPHTVVYLAYGVIPFFQLNTYLPAHASPYAPFTFPFSFDFTQLQQLRCCTLFHSH
jgi:hypothetical protein